jgi:hypothetical protein
LELGREYCASDDAEKKEMASIPFREMVGLLQYICNETRPDITLVVNLLAQAMDNPGQRHWEAGKHIIRYLKGTRDYRLHCGVGSPFLTVYADASHGSRDLGWKSMSGYVVMLNGCPLAWNSKRQTVVALSTAESEYIALTHAARELVWIRGLLGELFRPITTPTTIHCDNQAAISMVGNDTFRPRTKHIALRYHFIRELVASDTGSVVWIPTDDNIADIFTKPLKEAHKYEKFASGLGLSA